MLTVEAHAKINLTLDILGKRPDGYHDVVMVMQAIGLADTLRFRSGEKGTGIKLAVIGRPDLPGDERNLAYRAAKLVMDTYGIERGVTIELTKRIPMAAGLAGGSADAAAVIRGLNELFKLQLSLRELCVLGEKIGSDVPFCICGGTMLAEGRGEVLTRLPDMPECCVVLAKPPADVATAWVYQNYQAEKAGRHPDTAAVLACLQAADLAGISCLLCNVLESVTIKKYKEIEQIKEIMCENGAMASLMSGSGSTVFGLAKDEQQAEFIADTLKKNTDAQVFVTKTVSRNCEGLGTWTID